MVLKRRFTDEEKIGLTSKEWELAEKYLRKHMTKSVVPDIEAIKLYEMYLIGCSFHEIHQSFPQYEYAQIMLTAALRKWGIDREAMQSTLRDRVKAKVVKSVIDQVDFLTSMLSVANTENLEQMRKYMLDASAPLPALRIKSIKDYKDITETLGKIVQGATPNAKSNHQSPIFDTLAPKFNKVEESKKKKKIAKDDDIDLADLLGGEDE